jgi:L-threonate 2-dehydrogenase
MNKIVGIMGGAIAPNLVDRGWTVFGFDVDKEKSAALAKRCIIISDNAARSRA